MNDPVSRYPLMIVPQFESQEPRPSAGPETVREAGSGVDGGSGRETSPQVVESDDEAMPRD